LVFKPVIQIVVRPDNQQVIAMRDICNATTLVLVKPLPTSALDSPYWCRNQIISIVGERYLFLMQEESYV
jgi:hypothetical protein